MTVCVREPSERHTSKTFFTQRRSRNRSAIRTIAASPSPLRASSTPTNRFPVPSHQSACLWPAAVLSTPDAAVPIRAQRSRSRVTNTAQRWVDRASRWTARCSANRAGSNTCGPNLQCKGRVIELVGGGEECVLEDEKPPYSE